MVIRDGFSANSSRFCYLISTRPSPEDYSYMDVMVFPVLKTVHGQSACSHLHIIDK